MMDNRTVFMDENELGVEVSFPRRGQVITSRLKPDWVLVGWGEAPAAVKMLLEFDALRSELQAMRERVAAIREAVDPQDEPPF